LAKKKKTEKKPREMTRRQLSQHKRQQRRQRIIFISGISIIAAVVLIVLVGWLIGEYLPMHRTVVKVNDVKFDTRYFIDALKIEAANQNIEQLDAYGATVLNNIIQREMFLQAAEKVGITVSAEEVRKDLENLDNPVPDAYVDIIRVQRVETRFMSEYIGSLVPFSDNQVNINAMLVESDSLAQELLDRLIAGDNFTALAGEYAQNYTSKQNNGIYGWHPEPVLEDQLGSLIPINFAFSAELGTTSQPLHDADAYKQLGYWLIKVTEVLEDEQANVQALFLSSREEALDIRARLESGDNMSALADEYSQYSPSKEGHGDLGLISRPSDPEKTAITAVFDSYVFDTEVKIGEWSEPVSEDTLWTRGGAWLVELIDRDDNRELSTEDRDVLIRKKYSQWLADLSEDTSINIDRSGFTLEVNQWAAEKARQELQQD
jgi:parvulin-like peptidyl-prolyl isomerase